MFHRELITLITTLQRRTLITPKAMTTPTTKETFNKLFSKIDELKPDFINTLGEAVAIPAVSGDETMRDNVFKKADFIKDRLAKLKFQDIKLVPLGVQPPPVAVPDLPLPPVILSRYGNDPSKKTLLVYGHYDVQPAKLDDGWDTEPFKMVVDEKNDIMQGRGTTDDTGPLIGWLNAVEAHQSLGLELPVNLVTCFEGMEESGSLGLEELIKKEANGYFKGVDAVCISDNYWLGTKKPVLTYGLRGCNYYQIIVEGPKADLHSGVFGGIIAEPMTDLIQVMSKLVTPQGEILIPGVNEMVAPVTPAEEETYKDIDFSVDELNLASGSKTALYQEKRDILMHRWRYPSLSLHGIEGAFADAGAKTVIPAKVTGKFSIRTVPDMDSDKLNDLVIKYCNENFKKLNSPNKIHVELIHDGAYWVSDPHNVQFEAAKKATELVYGVQPDLTREGGSIPITITFQDALNTSVLLLPMGRGDDGAHSINEKLNISNYINGIKLMSSYLHYYAEAK